jgi:hypothetical protein
MLNRLSTTPLRDKGVGGIAPPFLTSALDGSEWLASRPCRYTPGARDHGTRWIGGWLSRKLSVDAEKKRKVTHCRESNVGRLACIPSLYQLRYPGSKNGQLLGRQGDGKIRHMKKNLRFVDCEVKRQLDTELCLCSSTVTTLLDFRVVPTESSTPDRCLRGYL